jgi:hypothetical protein
MADSSHYYPNNPLTAHSFVCAVPFLPAPVPAAIVPFGLALPSCKSFCKCSHFSFSIPNVNKNEDKIL